MSTHSVDDLIVKVQNEQSGVTTPPPSEPVPVASMPESDSGMDLTEPEVSETEGHADRVPETKSEEESSDPYAKSDESDTKPVSTDPIDEYGNPVEKPKTYSEEDVQRMIRERLARGRQAEQPVNPQVQKAAENFQSDPNSDESWEVQLKTFIKKTNEEIRHEESEAKYLAEQAQKQAEFESKFTTGMNKYKDFHQVTSGKPITNAVMRAAMNLEDPAAFIYAVGKMHPQEFENMARLTDPIAVGAAVGRLDERMRKESRLLSAAPKPVSSVKGDMPIKQHEQPSLDQRIIQHAKQKFARG